MAPRVLCYSPYNRWTLHGMWELTMLHGAKLRGADVHLVMCDGLYTDCDVFWAASAPRFSTSCSTCQASTTHLAASMGMDFNWLGRYLTLDEIKQARAFADSLDVSELVGATWGDWPVGAWMKSSVHSHFRMNDLDFGMAEVRDTYRSYVYSGLVACFGLTRLFDDYKPDVCLLFNGRQSSTRVALEMAKARNIRIICHERGFLTESLLLWEDENVISLQPYRKLWREWGNIPLCITELEKIQNYLHEREYGRNITWVAFSPPPQEISTVRDKLGLDANRPVWVLFTTSDDELAGHPEWHGPHHDQLKWMDSVVEFVAEHADIQLVIRVHPNTAGDKAKLHGDNVGQQNAMIALNRRLPENAVMVMAEDDISTYTLMEIGDVGLTYVSITGLEMACKGKAIVVGGKGPVADTTFTHTLNKLDENQALLTKMLGIAPGARSRAVLRDAYRFAYGLFFRLNIPFPLVHMPGPTTGKLTYSSQDSLVPGKDPALDRVCRVLLNGESPCPAPGTRESYRSSKPEDTWLDERLPDMQE